MSSRTFEAIAYATLIVGALVVYHLSPSVIGWLTPLWPEETTAATVLGIVLTALGVTIVWAILMLPIRARSELVPLGEELAQIRARGGFGALIREEQDKLERAGKTTDPARRRWYHARMAGAGLLVSCLAALVAFILWADDLASFEAFAVVAVAAILTLYHVARFFLTRGAPRS